MSFDLASSLRRLKPQRLAPSLRRRTEQDLPFAPAPATTGPELLLDTCVYIDVLQGRAPAEVKDLLSLRIVSHSTVALSELTHLFGRLDPGHPQTRGVLQQLSAVVDGIPSHRLSGPSVR